MPKVADKEVRHWFVTGGSGGLGRRIVEHALRQGDRVTATVRRAGALGDLAEEFGDRVTEEVLDLTRLDDVDDVVGRVIAADPVDVVVNNAGFAVVGATEEQSVQQIREQLDVMLTAPLLITRAFVRPMREQGGGRIIQISSMGGQVAVPTHSSYHAAKWGLEGFSESVNREVSGFGVHLTVIEPGGTRTGFKDALTFAPELDAYRGTPVDQVRRQLREMDPNALTGDPDKIAAIVYQTTRQSDPPVRLTLGGDSYDAVRVAMTERLTALEDQRAVAESVAVGD
ncbi:SDR family oxidoreductase [Mycolicibacterium sp. P1-18]|uniref:SDR family oxidoreductase n=1 Tax=Mycolicibacterium sp. P1-18 TaxID=2024615 RepID=UPI0011F2CC75|nr:SDR family oxidoreductase [Mycolicibacterium sp. P1-18]KAA0094127.1 SDR family oxidoreductase [Mycolicibacterium sp. P1-18]